MSAITRPAGKPFANIKVAPAADLSTSREVLLVLPRVDEIDMASEEILTEEIEAGEPE
ncbi:MAG: hypothetical protein ACI9QV_000758 [Methylophagaceae bacterium]